MSSATGLLDLPAEVRNSIYDHVVDFGEMHLFSTSKLIRQEGLPRSFNVYFGYADRPCALPPKHATATPLIQNVELHINLGGARQRSYDCKLVECFGGSHIARKSCAVLLDYGTAGYLSFDCARSSLFGALRTLTGFKDLTVRLVFGSDRWSRSDEHNDWRYELAKDALESTLGPATYQVKGEERHLEFHPYEWNVERWVGSK